MDSDAGSPPEADAGLLPVVDAGTPPEADAGSPPAADAGSPPDGGFRVFDGNSPYPGLTPLLLDPGVKTVFAISPDERKATVSHDPQTWCTCNPHSSPACTEADNAEISIVTIGEETITLPVRARSAGFSPDGRFITLGTYLGTCRSQALFARADGTDLQPNPGFSFGDGWIYSSDENGFYRQRDLGDAREQIAGPAGASISPDGDALFTCPPSGCMLYSPIGKAAPVPVPGASAWTMDGRYVLAYPCGLYDRAGRAYKLCDQASLAPRGIALLTGDETAFVTEDETGFTAHVRNFLSGVEAAFAPFASPAGASLTPDGTRVISGTSENPLDPASAATLFIAPASGGAWTRLLDHVGRWAISADSRVIALGSMSSGLYLSVDGGPAQRISVPGLALSWLPPSFEPGGGAGRALYDEFPSPNNINTVVGNEDGSGDWLRLPRAFCAQWIGHTAACSGPDGLVLVHGDEVGVVGDHATSWTSGGAGRSIFFIAPGGLYVVDNPAP